MSKFLKVMIVLLTIAAVAAPAMAAEFTFHGDLNNRFGLYTNQAGMFSGVENVNGTNVSDNDVDEFFADFKYRANTTAATNDGAVKGVLALEIGGIQYGTSPAGDYSGDGVKFEVRKAYTQFKLPNSDNSLSMGLQALTINKFVWWETVPSVQYRGKAGALDYKLAWARGNEVLNTSSDDNLFKDADALVFRADMKPADNVKAGAFLLYQRKENADNFTYNADDGGTQGAKSANSGGFYEIKQIEETDYDIYTIGTDGKFTAGNLFVNWDLIYQGGSVDEIRSFTAANTFTNAANQDVSSYFLHADAGIKVGKATFTYTGWIASGDDDDTDDEINNYLATDVDRADSVIFFEGGYTDDDYFTEAPYILNKGLILNKIAADLKVSKKTTVGGALLYLMTAEDLANGESALGTEIDAYVSHELYPNVEVALNAGYLVADDGMNNFVVGGAEAENPYRVTSRIRYKF